MGTAGASHRKRVNFVVCKSPEELAGKAAKLFSRAAQDAVRKRGFFNAGLSGGSTPRLTLQTLALEPARSQILWKKTNLFWVDERYVPPDDPRSNFRLARETLISKVPLPEENLYPMPTHPEDPREAARIYEELLRDKLQSTGGLDFIFLGMGLDGHTASLFPGSPLLEEKERWVGVAEAPAQPGHRLTLTYPILNATSQVVFLVSGDEKAGTFKKILTQEQNLPAQKIQPASGNLTWLSTILP